MPNEILNWNFFRHKHDVLFKYLSKPSVYTIHPTLPSYIRTKSIARKMESCGWDSNFIKKQLESFNDNHFTGFFDDEVIYNFSYLWLSRCPNIIRLLYKSDFETIFTNIGFSASRVKELIYVIEPLDEFYVSEQLVDIALEYAVGHYDSVI
jgi:hypothetical protein